MDGAVDLEFALFDVAVSGSPLVTLPALENVAVVDGLFAVQLDFGGGQFTGDARWLEIRARDGASVGPFVVNGRQQLTATPYALFATAAGSANSANTATNATNATNANTATTALAAPWTGLTGMPLGFSDGVDDSFLLPFSATINSASPLFSLVNSNGGYSGVSLGGPLTGIGSTSPGSAIIGESTSGLYGVYGKSLSQDFPAIAYGVRGDGEAAGVYGLGISGGSAGVKGDGVSYGVHGQGTAYGVFGTATSVTGTGIRGEGLLYGVDGAGSVGVHGQSLVTGGYGVRGEAVGDGVYGQTTTLGKAGIVGVAASGAGTNYAGFFLGNVNVDGNLSANTINNLSDARSKRDIATGAYGLDAVLRLRPVSFAWIDRPDASMHLGFIAQEVRDVVPEVVDVATDEAGTLSVRSLELLPVIVRAIQEQELRLATVESVCLAR